MITETTRKLLRVPESFVDDIGGVTLASWWPAIEMAITALKAPVVEIGADRGFATKALAAKCAEIGVGFTSVDPNPAPYVDEIAAVDHRRVTSEAFFKDSAAVPAAGVWIVDGDHNYATVRMELENIDRFTLGRDTVIFLHDIGWPWGRRDLWYNAANAPADAHRAAAVSLDDEFAVPAGKGIYMGAVQAVAPREGGPANGVMTAVEDFLESSQGKDWLMMWSPIFYGFGFLARKSTFLSGRIDGLQALFAALQQAGPILGPLEFNRLRLLQTTNIKWTESADKDSRIAELENSETALKKLLRAREDLHSRSLSTRLRIAFNIIRGR